MFYTDLQSIELEQALNLTDPSSLRFYCASPSLRHAVLFQGRPIQLSESSLQVFEVIAAYGRKGLTQAELAKVLGCDSKNAFHWLKSLVANDLIARTPVASKKSFTYLLTLTKYLDEEISHQHQEIPQQGISNQNRQPTSPTSTNHNDTHTVVSSKEIRQSIIDILAKAPAQTMVSKDVFDQTGLDPLLIKNFRRAATKLNEIGWLEYLFEDQLVGPYCRLFRLKRRPAEGLDLKSFLVAQDETKRLDSKDKISLSRGSDYRPDHPILHQLISLLADSFPDPMTTSDLSHRLNITRKYLYKMIDRIIPQSDKKAGVIGAEGVGKVSDFVGKEKRLKLFIKSEEWRDYYLKLFAGTETIIDAPSSSPLLNSRPSTPLISVPSARQSPSDTRTRQLRHQAILQELSQHRILEIGKELCHRIQSILGDNRFTLDLKTLRRSIEILERENQVKVVVTSLPIGTRSLLISPELSASDEIVQNYISKLSENVRSAPLSASTIKLEKLKKAMQQPDYFVDGSLPFGIPQNPSVNTRALVQFGFISGVLSRAQLFHEFLINNTSGDGGFETLPTIFERIPLSLYFSLIGTVRMSRNLYNSLPALNHVPIAELPESYREEVSLNRKRFQSQVSILLGILEDLRLIQGEEQFASLNFKLPFRYNFAVEVPLYNYKGQVVKITKFTHDSGFHEFWNGMHQIAHEYNSKSISIHSEEDDDTSDVPKVILLARHADSWRDKPSRERDLEKAVRRLAIELFDTEKSQRRQSVCIQDGSSKLEAISSEFQVPFERIATMLDNYKKILEEREESKRLSKNIHGSPGREFDSESESESDPESGTDKWTPADWSTLSLAFCILQQPFFLPGIKWNLASKVFDKPKSATIIRRHGLKLFKSYRELARIVETDSLVRLIMKSLPPLQDSSDDLVTIFKNVFDACRNEIDNLNESELIFNHFRPSSTHCLQVISDRQEHYLKTIDSWVQTRSFRHGLLQNQTGLQIISLNNVNPSRTLSSLSPTCLLLRQILVYSSGSSASSTAAVFDYDAIAQLIRSIDPSDLSESIDHLILIGFASKNKTRDHKRLFNFPLVISERVREVIEFVRVETVGGSSLLVENTTESLTMKRIEWFVDSFDEHDVELIKPGDESKFDAPIRIRTRPRTQNLPEMPTISSDPRSLWYSPLLDRSASRETATNCSFHVREAVKGQPGISVSDLKEKYENILTEFEVDSCVCALIESKSIELIAGHYLQ